METPTIGNVKKVNLTIRTKTDNSTVFNFKNRDPNTGVLSPRDISGSTFTAQARDPDDDSLAFDFVASFVTPPGTDGKLRLSVPKAIADLQTVGKDLCYDLKEGTGTEETIKADGIVYVKKGITD